MHFFRALFIFIFPAVAAAQLYVGRDTITVIENGTVLRSPWAGGLNFCEFSQADLDLDGKKDLVAYDKVNSYSFGQFRCFLNQGGSGQAKYTVAPTYSDKFPTVTDWAFLYDYNNDGKCDLFAYAVGGIKVYKNISTPGNLNFTLVKPLLYADAGAPYPVNIPSSPVSVPGLADVDHDGDMDILTFSTTGFQIEFYRNKSRELGYSPDSLVYDLYDNCWGDISENNCVVSLNQCPLKPLYEQALQNSSKVYHSGSCLMCFDRDGDHDMDLILGDVSCASINYMENAGDTSNAHIGDTTKLYPNYPLKANTPIIRLNYFPCTYNIDIDNDGKKDIVACPNSSGSENYKSVWYYRNTASGPVNDFQFVKNNLLQDEMIEVGEGAFPVLFDYNSDGLLDLLVGNLGYYNINTNRSMLTYYQNVGSLTQPSYSLVTRDFLGLSTYSLYSMVPAFGDIDGDNDIDMLIGDAAGKIHSLINSAGPGNPCIFGTINLNQFGISSSSSNAYPQIIDVDRDGKKDLLMGTKNGKLSYYRNTGTATSPAFTLISSSFGNVNVKGNPMIYGADGHCAPFMYDAGGSYKLLCGSISGRIYLYDNIDGNLGGSFNRIDTNINKINDGMQCALQYTDINGDSKRDLIVGNYAGGLTYYSSTKSVIGIKEESAAEENTMIFPNPAGDMIRVVVKDETVENVSIELMDMMGKTVFTTHSGSLLTDINTKDLARGVYILRVGCKSTQQQQFITKKIILQ